MCGYKYALYHMKKETEKKNSLHFSNSFSSPLLDTQLLFYLSLKTKKKY